METTVEQVQQDMRRHNLRMTANAVKSARHSIDLGLLFSAGMEMQAAFDYIFREGEEYRMVWRSGRPITSEGTLSQAGAWWTSFDIDAAFIVRAENMEALYVE
ncbi:MAG: hypothetical protein WD533_06590 [Dehalococcoidia bacterium]